MGIIAWIVLGLGAGLLANMAIPGRRSQGLIITCVIGIAGALLGGWLATKLFHVVTLHGFFNLSTWLTAIAGAAILLLAFHLVTSRGSSRSGRSRHRCAGGRTGERPGRAGPAPRCHPGRLPAVRRVTPATCSPAGHIGDPYVV
jgi:uncharacterized membrane protein YeaQ/YmgE (transglycosylase-associated protein family)